MKFIEKSAAIRKMHMNVSKETKHERYITIDESIEKFKRFKNNFKCAGMILKSIERQYQITYILTTQLFIPLFNSCFC